jgi:hypothetical protein
VSRNGLTEKRSHDTCRNIKQKWVFFLKQIHQMNITFWWLYDAVPNQSIKLTHIFLSRLSTFCFAIYYHLTTSCLGSVQGSHFQLTNQRRVYLLKHGTGTYMLRAVVWLVNINLTVFYMIIWAKMIESLLDITPNEMLLNVGVWSKKNNRYNKHLILIRVALCQHVYFCKWGLPRDAY